MFVAVKINPEQARALGLPSMLVERVAKLKLIASPPKAAKETAEEWLSKALK